MVLLGYWHLLLINQHIKSIPFQRAAAFVGYLAGFAGWFVSQHPGFLMALVCIFTLRVYVRYRG